MKIKLQEILDKHSLTQTELANKLNIAPSVVSRYANGKIEPNIDTLIKIADFLHISIDKLVGRKTSDINLEALDINTKTIISKVLQMNNTQISELLTIIDTLSNFK